MDKQVNLQKQNYNGNQPRQSRVTKEIIKLLLQRDDLGWQKFGTALEDAKRNRLVDLQEELIDSLQYITSILMLIQEFKDGPDNAERKEVYAKALAEKLLNQ